MTRVGPVVPFVVALLAVLVLALSRALPLPGRVAEPPFVAFVALAGLAFGVGMLAQPTLSMWIGLVAGFLTGVVLSVLFQGMLAASYVVPEWLMTREEWILGLTVTVGASILALAVGYVAASLLAGKLARVVGPTRPWQLIAAIALPLMLAPAMAIGFSATIVEDEALLVPGRPIIEVRVTSDGGLSIEPTDWPAGGIHYRTSNESNAPVSLMIVPLRSDGDLGRLQAGEQGFTFMAWDYVAVGQSPQPGRIQLEPGRHAIYVVQGDAGAEGEIIPGSRAAPIPDQSLVVITVATDE